MARPCVEGVAWRAVGDEALAGAVCEVPGVTGGTLLREADTLTAALVPDGAVYLVCDEKVRAIV